MLQVVSEIPEECATHGVLRDVAIEIVDENGNIDTTMTGGQNLIIVSCAQQSAYPLREGTCCINSIQLPDEPGPWCCHINHVMYEELEAEIKLNLVANSGHSMEFPDLTENDEGPTLMLPDKSGSFPELEKLLEGILERIEDLKRKMAYCVQKVKNAEIELDKLNERKKMEADSISQLEGEIESLYTQAESLQKNSSANGQDKNEITAEKIAEEISRTNFPAKFLLEAFCTDSFLSATTGNPHIADILGIVCLLGFTKEEALSRALADFIGEESLLAVVCKTHEAAGLLIRLNQLDGSIDESSGLYDYIKSQKQNIHGKLRIFILEDMRWYNEGLDESPPQILLTMDQPTLNGRVPNGFLGYAVNLIQMNDEHLQLRVGGEDHGGLRGSLFYSLFKNLQVYDTRKNLFRAKGALTTGGVSLDGGLIRDKGCEEFGQWQKAKILFPVHSKAGKRIPSLRSINHITQTMQIRDALKEKRHELQDCKMRLDQTKSRIDYVKRRIKSREAKFESTMTEMEKSKEELAQITKSMQSV